MNRNRIILILLLCVYSLLLLSYFKSSCMHTSWCGQDMDQYVDYSDSLLTGHGYSAQKVASMYMIVPQVGLYVPETMRLPAYPLSLTLGRLFYNHPDIVIYYNIFFLLCILFFSYKLFDLFFPKFSILPFIFILLSPVLLFYTTLSGNADIFSYAATVGFLYGACLIYQHKINKSIFLLTFLCGIGAIFSRQNTLIFIFPLVVIPILTALKNKTFDGQAKAFLSLFLGFALLLGIWCIRSYTITKKFTLSTASDSQLFNEYIYFTPYPNPETDSLNDWMYRQKAGQAFMQKQVANHIPIPIAFMQFSKIQRQKTHHYIVTHPYAVLKQFKASILSLFSDTTFVWKEHDSMATLKQIDTVVSQSLAVLFFIFPLLFMLQKHKDPLSLSIWIGAFLFIVLSAFFHGTVVGNRGILPVYSVIVLLSFKSAVDILRTVFYGSKIRTTSR